MSEPLSPAAMAAVSAAATPRAVRHFGLAAMEARAARSRGAVQPPPRSMPPEPMSWGPIPSMPPAAAPAARRVRVRLWLPLSALFLLLAPFALVLALPCYLAPPRWRRDPIRTALAIGRVLLALGGTIVDVDTPEALVRIRIF